MKDCNRDCLIGVMDGYMNAIYMHDPKAAPPLAIDVRMTENTGHVDGADPFKIYIADPVTGQVALQARLIIQGRTHWSVYASKWIAARFPRSNSFTIATSTTPPYPY